MILILGPVVPITLGEVGERSMDAQRIPCVRGSDFYAEVITFCLNLGLLAELIKGRQSRMIGIVRKLDFL